MSNCHNPACGSAFTRTRPWQKFCTSQCRAAMRNRTLKDHYAPASAVAVMSAAMDWLAHGGSFETVEELKAACERHRIETKDEENIP